MRLKLWITRLHYRSEGRLPWWLLPLLPLEWGYRLGVSLRLLGYRCGLLRSYQSPVPVISVGNLTTGGTGKTPIVIAIARGLVQAGKTVVILSRGYGAAEPVGYSRALDPKYGDEPYLIQEQVPEAIVIVGRDRVSNLQRALHDYRPDYVILDDGFQHLKLDRTLNILLVDGGKLAGNGHLLPLGPLREPLAEIDRADLVFVTKTVNQTSLATVSDWLERFGPVLPKQAIQVLPVPFQAAGLRPMGDFKSLTSHTTSAESFGKRPVIAFSALAQPEQFERDLRTLGLNVVEHRRFEDHHVYTADDVAELLEQFSRNQGQNPLLVTTDKDLTKVRSLLPQPVQAYVYTLQMLPVLDGYWFYDEFLTQIPDYSKTGATHAFRP